MRRLRGRGQKTVRNPLPKTMNFLGLDVTGLDLERFLESGKAIYLCLYALWIALVFRGGRRMWVWGPPVLALVCWFVATFPLQQSYGLAAISDRMRNLWWCATVAAGQPIWESGVLDRMSLEPFWSLFVSLLSLRNPARVMTVYPFLPALAIVLVGCGLTVSALKILPDDAFEGQFPADRWRLALWCSFFVLLASTGPVDYLNPYRGFWKTFMLKPNHALAFAVVPVSVAMLSRAMSWRRSIAVAVLLGLLGWAFIVYWALTCWGIVLYTAWTFAGAPPKRSEAVRIVGALAGGLLIVLPYVYFLIHQFPETVNFAPGVSADDPLRSVWGESPPRAQSLFFLSTFDLGANFYMALYGFWTSLFRGSRFDRLCVSLVAGAYSAWAVGGLLLLTGRGRQSDEIYYFLVFVVSIQAGVGTYRFLERASGVIAKLAQPRLALFAQPRKLTAAALGLWLPLTLGWWWNPLIMDAHFRRGLAPPPRVVTVIGDWIIENTNETDVFLAGAEPALWIPALSGRRIVFEHDLEQVQNAMDRRVLTHVALAPLAAGNEPERAARLENRRELLEILNENSRLETVFTAGSVSVYSLSYPER